MYVYMHVVPYSGTFSRVKTFTNFTVLGQFANVLTAKFFIEYGGVIINGVSLSFPTNRKSFNRENPTFNNLRKFSPAKDSRYTVCIYAQSMHCRGTMFFAIFIVCSASVKQLFPPHAKSSLD